MSLKLNTYGHNNQITHVPRTKLWGIKTLSRCIITAITLLLYIPELHAKSTDKTVILHEKKEIDTAINTVLNSKDKLQWTSAVELVLNEDPLALLDNYDYLVSQSINPNFIFDRYKESKWNKAPILFFETNDIHELTTADLLAAEAVEAIVLKKGKMRPGNPIKLLLQYFNTLSKVKMGKYLMKDLLHYGLSHSNQHDTNYYGNKSSTELLNINEKNPIFSINSQLSKPGYIVWEVKNVKVRLHLNPKWYHYLPNTMDIALMEHVKLLLPNLDLIIKDINKPIPKDEARLVFGEKDCFSESDTSELIERLEFFRSYPRFNELLSLIFEKTKEHWIKFIMQNINNLFTIPKLKTLTVLHLKELLELNNYSWILKHSPNNNPETYDIIIRAFKMALSKKDINLIMNNFWKIWTSINAMYDINTSFKYAEQVLLLSLENWTYSDLDAIYRNFKHDLSNSNNWKERDGNDLNLWSFKDYALRKLAMLNAMHNEEEGERMKLINKFPPEFIYSMIVIGNEEVYTSTFNLLFSWSNEEDWLLSSLKKKYPKWAYEFLNKVDPSRKWWSTFLRTCAQYGKLNILLWTIESANDKKLLLSDFIEGLKTSNKPIEDAVSIIEIIHYISNQAWSEDMIKFLSNKIKLIYEELVLTQKEDDKSQIIQLYGFIASALSEYTNENREWYNDMKDKYKLPNLFRINEADLFWKWNTNLQAQAFYNDEDWINSYNHFNYTYKQDSTWKAHNERWYIYHSKIDNASKRKILLYSNNPESYNPIQEQVAQLYWTSNIQLKTEWHRWHSYHAYKTIEKISPSTLIVYLWSCWSYNNVSEVLKRAPNAHIISTKWIWSMLVNDVISHTVNNYMLSNGYIDWQIVWSLLTKHFEEKAENWDNLDKKALKYFANYVPPHKNTAVQLQKVLRNNN